MSNSEIPVVTYTTAEADYDGFGTQTLSEVGRTTNGKVIRKVQTPARHLRWQRMRYASGCKMVADEAEYQDLVGYNLVRPLAEAAS